MPGEKIPIIIISTIGGINERKREWALENNEVAFNRGWDNSIDGIRRKRPGVKSFYADTTKRSLGMFTAEAFYHTFVNSTTVLDEDDAILAIFGDELRAVRGTGSSSRQPNGTGSGATFSDQVFHMMVEGFIPHQVEVGTSLAMNRAYFISQCHQHHTNVTVGTDLFAWTIDVLGLGVMDWTQVTNVRPTAIAWLQGRLWVANNLHLQTQATGSLLSGGGLGVADFTHGSDLQPSDLYKGADFTHPYIAIEPGLGGDITALWPLRRGENSALLVGKQSAIAVFEPRWGAGGGHLSAATDTLDTIESKIRVLTRKIGIAAQRSVVEVPSEQGTDILFLASDAHVRYLSRAATDVEAGAGIPLTYNQPDLVDRINRQHMRKSTAAFFDNKYFISVPLDGALENTHLLVFDLIRNGALIGIEDLACASLEVVKSFEGPADRAFLFAQYANITTDCSFTGAVSGFNIFKLYDPNSALDPGGVAVSAREDGQAFTVHTFEKKKRWSNFKLMVEPATDVTGSISVAYSLDSGPFTNIGSQIFEPTTDRRLFLRKIGLEDVEPSYTIQFRVESGDTARPSVVYTGVEARIIEDEQDNEIT